MTRTDNQQWWMECATRTWEAKRSYKRGLLDIWNGAISQTMAYTGLMIFRAVAEPQISTKSAKSREIRQKSYQIHVGTIYFKVILAVGVAYLL